MGERFDADDGLYQLRARYYDPAGGRFLSRDPFDGRPQSPVSLHRYLYANADPVNFNDPTGRETLLNITLTQASAARSSSSIRVSATNQDVQCVHVLGTVGYTVMADQSPMDPRPVV